MEVNQYQPTVCTPLILEKVCASGRKCFHNIHYLFEDENGRPIPPDACPVNCIVSNFFIYATDGNPCPPGFLPPRRVGDCICFTVHYRVRVWFEHTTPTGVQDVHMAVAEFDRELCVPVEEIAGGCVLCDPQDTDICVRRLAFDCIRANLVPTPFGFPCNFPPFAIEVTVEKEFFALESGRSIVCIPTCVDECIELPPPVAGDVCIPFEREGVCDDWCEDTDMNPDNCAQCPPPQVND